MGKGQPGVAWEAENQGGSLSSFTVWINATCTNVTNHLEIEIDGVNRSTPIRMDWDSGSTHHLRVYTESRPDGCVYCHFASWEDGSTDLNRTIFVDGAIEVMGQFDDYYEVSVYSNLQPFESFSVSLSLWDGDIVVYPGPDLIIAYVRPSMRGAYTDSPQIGALSLKPWLLDHWSVSMGSQMFNTTDNPVALDVTTCGFAVAYFVPDYYIQVRIITDAGPLAVGYDNSPLSPAPVGFQSEYDKVHTLRTVSPQAYGGTLYAFVNWLNGPAELNWTVTLPWEKYWEYQANFLPTHHRVNIEASPTCGGQVTPSSGWYEAGTVLNIEWAPSGPPVPDERRIFWSWEGEGIGSYTGQRQSAQVKVDGPINETANCFRIKSIDEGIRSENLGQQPAEHGPNFAAESMRECLMVTGGRPGVHPMAVACEILCPPKACR